MCLLHKVEDMAWDWGYGQGWGEEVEDMEWGMSNMDGGGWYGLGVGDMDRGDIFLNWVVGLELKPELVYQWLFTNFVLLYFCIWWKHHKDLIKPRGVIFSNVYTFVIWWKTSSVEAYLIICCKVYQ